MNIRVHDGGCIASRPSDSYTAIQRYTSLHTIQLYSAIHYTTSTVQSPSVICVRARRLHRRRTVSHPPRRSRPPAPSVACVAQTPPPRRPPAASTQPLLAVSLQLCGLLPITPSTYQPANSPAQLELRGQATRYQRYQCTRVLLQS